MPPYLPITHALNVSGALVRGVCRPLGARLKLRPLLERSMAWAGVWDS